MLVIQYRSFEQDSINKASDNEIIIAHNDGGWIALNKAITRQGQ